MEGTLREHDGVQVWGKEEMVLSWRDQRSEPENGEALAEGPRVLKSKKRQTGPAEAEAERQLAVAPYWLSYQSMLAEKRAVWATVMVVG